MLWFVLGVYVGGGICHAGVLARAGLPWPLLVFFALIWPVALLCCPKEER
jgi:hypothetical protein